MDELTCKGCQQPKPLTEFYADTRYRSGYKNTCKSCLNERSTAWRKANPENARASTQRWRARNPDKVQQANRVPRQRTYEPEKTKERRLRRYDQPGYRKKVNTAVNERAKRVREWVNTYKLEHGCVDCGYKEHFVALEFDHVKGEKSFNVCNSKSITQAQKEIEKCDVRCANCHAIRTWERFHEKNPPQPDHM